VRALGEEFHRHLVKQAGNARLLLLLEEIREQIRSVWTTSILGPRRVRALLGEHLAIIDALKGRDTARAERLVVAHLRRVRETIFRLLD
jgi:DNA-binding GntR family transcriptional regulator